MQQELGSIIRINFSQPEAEVVGAAATVATEGLAVLEKASMTTEIILHMADPAEAAEAVEDTVQREVLDTQEYTPLPAPAVAEVDTAIPDVLLLARTQAVEADMGLMDTLAVEIIPEMLNPVSASSLTLPARS